MIIDSCTWYLKLSVEALLFSLLSGMARLLFLARRWTCFSRFDLLLTGHFETVAKKLKIPCGFRVFNPISERGGNMGGNVFDRCKSV